MFTPTSSRPVFRFAPSPNGRLHLGHAYSALLNEHLAREAEGRFLLRIEDIDPARSRPDFVEAILSDLAWLGLSWEEPVRRQSEHMADYETAAARLRAEGLLYPCFCSRAEIGRAAEAVAEHEGRSVARDPDGAPLYPGTCRGLSAKEIAARMAEGRRPAWRLAMADALARIGGEALLWTRFDPGRLANPGPLRSRTGNVLLRHPEEARGASRLEGRMTVSRASRRACGAARHDAGREACSEPGSGDEGGRPFEGALTQVLARPARWGDAVLVRRDTPTSYHLSVVIDDAIQCVTHVVRGRDLEAATDLHRLLQALLALPSPRYHHHALIRDEDGEKLAKRAGSPSLSDLRQGGETPGSIRRRLGV